MTHLIIQTSPGVTDDQLGGCGLHPANCSSVCSRRTGGPGFALLRNYADPVFRRRIGRLESTTLMLTTFAEGTTQIENRIYLECVRTSSSQFIYKRH